jgi:hypothetical protein
MRDSVFLLKVWLGVIGQAAVTSKHNIALNERMTRAVDTREFVMFVGGFAIAEACQ